MIITEDTYFSKEAELEYCGSSQYRDFFGTTGRKGCEARALARINGEYVEETPEGQTKKQFLIGNYVDAYFSGTMPSYVAQNGKEMVSKKTGALLKDFVRANEMIARVEQDEYFMKTLSGGSQVIRSAEAFGIKWKVKMDSYHAGIAIVDLKTTQSITKRHYVKDLGRVTFVEYWGYDIQLALYQHIDYLVTGKKLPILLACVSKEPIPDIEIIGIDQNRLDECIAQIELNAPRLIELKTGKAQPTRCQTCDYCKQTKVLTSPIHYSEILEEV